MNEKLVTVARFTDYLKAEIAKQLLEDNGIKAVIMGENVGNIFGGLPAMEDIELQTPQSQANEAKQILEASAQEEPVEDEDEDQDEDLDSDLDEGPEQE